MGDVDRVTWEEALEIEVEQSKIHRYRWLCSDDNPDKETREGYRKLMIKLATGEPDLPEPQEWVAPPPIVGGCCGG